MPPLSAVIEIREDVAIDADVVDACRNLHQLGFVLALDDFVSGSEAEALMPFVKFVKVDVLQTTATDRAMLAARLRQRGIRLIGDVPIYVSDAGADVEAWPELFARGEVAGAPPDALSAPLQGCGFKRGRIATT